MTVALGLVCLDGVLVASDSMATGQGFASTSIKVRTFDRIPAVWTAAGSVFVMEEVTTVLNSEDAAGSAAGPLAVYTTPDLPLIRKRLHDNINPVMRKAYGKSLNVAPPQNGLQAIAHPAEFLFLGYSNSTPWFLELASDGQANWHTEPGFYAVGSGGPFATVAHALMEHYTLSSLTLEHGKQLAYRAIDTTIRSSAFGVGGPVQMAICDADGARVLSSDEISDLQGAVEVWKTLERETLIAAVTSPGMPAEETQDSEIPSLGDPGPA